MSQCRPVHWLRFCILVNLPAGHLCSTPLQLAQPAQPTYIVIEHNNHLAQISRLSATAVPAGRNGITTSEHAVAHLIHRPALANKWRLAGVRPIKPCGD
jgi:hypothetical protein